MIGDDLGPPSTTVHAHLKQRSADLPDEAFRERHARRMLGEAARYLPRVADAPVDRVTVSWRPMPKNGQPIVGTCRDCANLYLPVTHRGVTLAPIPGELASIEILDGVDVQPAAPYRLTRFAAA